MVLHETNVEVEDELSFVWKASFLSQIHGCAASMEERVRLQL
jgi:hypothetical protein